MILAVWEPRHRMPVHHTARALPSFDIGVEQKVWLTFPCSCCIRAAENRVAELVALRLQVLRAPLHCAEDSVSRTGMIVEHRFHQRRRIELTRVRIAYHEFRQSQW